MKFFSYKDIIYKAILKYLNELEVKQSRRTNHRIYNPKSVPWSILEIELFLTKIDNISNKDVGLIISNFPFLIDYLEEGFVDELARSRS